MVQLVLAAFAPAHRVDGLREPGDLVGRQLRVLCVPFVLTEQDGEARGEPEVGERGVEAAGDGTDHRGVDGDEVGVGARRPHRGERRGERVGEVLGRVLVTQIRPQHRTRERHVLDGDAAEPGELRQLDGHGLLGHVDDEQRLTAGERRPAEGGEQTGPAVTGPADDIDPGRPGAEHQREPGIGRRPPPHLRLPVLVQQPLPVGHPVLVCGPVPLPFLDRPLTRPVVPARGIRRHRHGDEHDGQDGRTDQANRQQPAEEDQEHHPDALRPGQPQRTPVVQLGQLRKVRLDPHRRPPGGGMRNGPRRHDELPPPPLPSPEDPVRHLTTSVAPPCGHTYSSSAFSGSPTLWMNIGVVS
ncbi:hypothetical protein ACFWFZ_21720 [Streptomyces sp. NPDC060232]|uniref:hypothetical protein n=1 Tax=Streptomyces sp. NPDC060232 TaxID=3347079 RepID=UPI00364F3BFC